MSKIFIFTAGNPEARSHLESSIIHPADKNIVLSSFPSDQQDILNRIYEEEGGFYAWGAIPGAKNIVTWKNLDAGDWVLCVYKNEYRFVSKAKQTFDNYECAKNIWGLDGTGKTWQLMYFLTKPIQPINGSVPAEKLNEYLHTSYMGFTQISSERLNRISEDYGSIDDFIQEAFHGNKVVETAKEIQRLCENKEKELENLGSFDPNNIEDARERVTASIVQRRGQPAFRKALLDLYDQKCAITQYDVPEALEAAHILPYQGEETNHPSNGLLLRSDLHTLFDYGLIAIDGETGKVKVADKLRATRYAEIEGLVIKMPKNVSGRANRDALNEHLRKSGL
jgi:hypothetical protein